MKNDLFLYMKRNGNYWHMDMDTYFRFIKHVHLYFRERVDLSEIAYSRMIYAEIPVRNMDIICFLFGGYSLNKEELILMEFFPKKVIFPWNTSFAIFLYTENSKPIPVFMDARH
ncbi:MAG: hypothetical protein H6Q12_378 [Bacteroidetes bacterium]|nr:hypothetical protein [Bacteroidota bacterium]